MVYHWDINEDGSFNSSDRAGDFGARRFRRSAIPTEQAYWSDVIELLE